MDINWKKLGISAVSAVLLGAGTYLGIINNVDDKMDTMIDKKVDKKLKKKSAYVVKVEQTEEEG